MEVQTDACPDVAHVDNVLAGDHGALYNQLIRMLSRRRNSETRKIMVYGDTVEHGKSRTWPQAETTDYRLHTGSV